MKQLTQEQAIKIFDSGVWNDMGAEQKVKLQLFQKRLCMPFGEFQGAMGQVLGRPVFTHEFASAEKLRSEYLGEREAPTMEEIIQMIPAEKLIFIET